LKGNEFEERSRASSQGLIVSCHGVCRGVVASTGILGVWLEPECHLQLHTLGAVLTLAHITESVEKWGPGGTLVDKPWRDELVGIATEAISSLQQEAGTDAEVIIDSGNVAEKLNLAAIRTRADVLIIGHLRGRSHLEDNDNGYSLMRESGIPVLSV
jgi:hypothetical protein